jgi:putative membrane protein
MKKEKILILCVDRDGDIKSKLGEAGPIYGREKTLDVAAKLALKDPSESDANALFGTVKIGDELAEEDKDVEIAAITGSENVGVESDAIISEQLEEVLKSVEPDGVVLVTDGAEDEYILPIIQSRTKVISVKRVIVKQSEQLESTYYAIQSFLKDVIRDPKLARVVFGIPGIAFILYWFFGEHGWRLTVGIVGTFLLIKGFGLEDQLRGFYEEFKSSFTTGRVSFFFYAVAVLIAAVGTLSGLDAVNDAGVAYGNIMKSVPVFISESVNLLAFAAMVALVGKGVDSVVEGHGVARYIFLGVLVVGVWLMANTLSLFILGQISQMDFAVNITMVLILSILTFLSIRSLKKMAAPARD